MKPGNAKTKVRGERREALRGNLGREKPRRLRRRGKKEEEGDLKGEEGRREKNKYIKPSATTHYMI